MERDRGGREGSVEVLGRAVKDGPWCQEVEYVRSSMLVEVVLRYSFIPIAHTFIIKALASISQRHITNQPKGSVAGTTKDPNLHLIAATCNGDLRSAINSLQMLKTGLKLGGAKGKRLPTRRDEIVADIKKSVKGRGSKGGKGAMIDADEGVRAA